MAAENNRNRFLCLADEAAAALIAAFSRLFNTLPIAARFGVVQALVDVILWLRPRYLELAINQIRESFPERSNDWHERVARGSAVSFVRAVVDFFRGPFVSNEWIDEHVEVVGYEELRAESERTGKRVVLVGGHVGSFDLLAQLTAVKFRPISFVIRNAKQRFIDLWWSRMRELRGNSTLPRSGAIKGMLKALRSGRDVGILFDQNVTAEFAVFVPWFGRLAATTKAVAVVALKAECLVAVSTLHYVGGERYRLECIRVPVSDLYESNLSSEEKVAELTRRSVSVLEAQILKFPEQWFWMHRRWRTRPLGEAPAVNA
jgi:KDO2-lipid IV(A) lauroyltransferase